MDPVTAMSPCAFRKLSSGERDLAQEVFGSVLDLDRIWIFAMPFWRRAFVTGGRLVVWPAAWALRDFSVAPLAVQGVFIHELVHVWQAQSGINLLWAKLRAGDGPQSYDYALSETCGMGDFNIEQQAMIVEHGFLSARGQATPFESLAYSAILADWQGSIWIKPQQI
jgi:hypothetical protein